VHVLGAEEAVPEEPSISPGLLFALSKPLATVNQDPVNVKHRVVTALKLATVNNDKVCRDAGQGREAHLQP